MVFFLLAVFFVPFVVITASYLVVTVRVWRFSGAHRSMELGERCDATSIRQVRSGCPDCEADAEDGEDDEIHTMETGAEYEMKVLSRGDSRNSRRNECRINGQVLCSTRSRYL